MLQVLQSIRAVPFSSLKLVAPASPLISISPVSVANFFLEKGEEDGRPLTHMQLQKLVYFANGWWLLKTESPLVSGTFQAWEYGPVHQALWEKFKRYGPEPVTDFAVRVRFEDSGTHNWVKYEVSNDKIRSFLGRVWATLKDFSAVQLSQMTHAQGASWDIVRSKTKGKRNAEISMELVRQEFEKFWKPKTN